MSKKVERLRAVYLNSDSLQQITNLQSLGGFSNIDLLLMENFRKIYHLGADQLDYFVNLLDKFGDAIDEDDPYTIIYYMDQLLSGPLAQYIPAALKKTPITLGTKYWSSAPDIIGVMKYLNKSAVQTPIDKLDKSAAQTTGQTIEITEMNLLLVNKCPQYIVDQYKKMTLLTNSVYFSGINDSLIFDNKLRGIIPEDKVATDKEPHGTYLAADTNYYEKLESVEPQLEPLIQASMKFLVDELKKDRYTQEYEIRVERTYNLYKYRSTQNYFKEEDTSRQYVINRLSEYKDGDTTKQVIIKTDLVGNTFESENVRRFGTLDVVNEDKNTILNLHTVRGQLGDISEPKHDPLIQKET